MKIATHNSATGELGHGIISWLVTPFAKCQSKTIKEQYYAGCRYFDIRVRKTKRGWVCAHGLWESKRYFIDILMEISRFCDCYVMITYEGEAPDDFTQYIDSIVRSFSNIKFTSINTKKPKWKSLRIYNNVGYDNEYKILDGSSWHTYLPIPWLWKRIYYDNTVFDTDSFTFVDFL